IVIFGLGFLLQQMDLFDFTSILANWWPIFFIIVGIIQLWTNGTQAIISSLIFIIVGIILLFNQWIDFKIWTLLWPFIIIMVGISIIFSRRDFKHNIDDRDEVHVKTFFSGAEMRNESDHFGGGSIIAVFGGVQLDLRNANFALEGATIDVTSVFGGVEIFLPDDIHVEIKGTPIFGGWEDKTRRKERGTA